MKISFVHSPSRLSTTHVLPIYQESKRIPKRLKELLERKPHATTVELYTSKKGQLHRIIALRLGQKAKSNQKTLEEAGEVLLKVLLEESCCRCALNFSALGKKELHLITGLCLANWHFSRYRTRLTPHEEAKIHTLEVVTKKPLEKVFRHLEDAVNGVLYARALTSEPPNCLPPEAYGERLKELQELGVEVELLSFEQIKAARLHALLAVSQGSNHPPCLAILHWCHSKEAPMAIVGKGVCFDSGGLCLKPTSQQHEMQWDNAGAGVVAGVIKSLALSKAPCHVIGVLGLVENMPGGSAYKPGDLIQTLSGQTVEIVNTDAEGRLVLADCLWYVQERFFPTTVIDLGTLTVETIAALGSAYAGLYSNDPQLTKRLKAAGEKSGDHLWELPMGPFFAKQICSPVADIKNVGIDLAGENGAAAEFLRCFIREGTAWAHLDIAGVSWTTEEKSTLHRRVTGFGVRLLREFIYATLKLT